MISVVYSQATGRIRSIVVPSQANEQIVCNLLPGEALQQFDISFAKQDLNFLQNALNQITGLLPSGDRYVMVDGGGNVISACICCPACGDCDPKNFDPKGTMPGCQMIQHDTASPGWTWTQQGGFVPFNPDPNPVGKGVQTQGVG
jgi:hypothetical protein